MLKTHFLNEDGFTERDTQNLTNLTMIHKKSNTYAQNCSPTVELSRLDKKHLNLKEFSFEPSKTRCRKQKDRHHVTAYSLTKEVPVWA